MHAPNIGRRSLAPTVRQHAPASTSMKPAFQNVVLLTALFVSSCDQGAQPEEFIELASGVVSQSVTAKTASSISFRALAGWGSSCGTFSRAEVTMADSIVFIKVFGKQPKKAFCAAVNTLFEAPVTITIPSPRTYTFKFWAGDSSKDTTVAVP